MKICLVGKHSNRTPFAYSEYKLLFKESFTYVTRPENADILIFGFFIDIKENIEIIKYSLKMNPQIQIVILSEEPLWDTLWSPDFTRKKQNVTIEGINIEFYFLNHETTDIFDFVMFPYFLTTSNDYIVRYHCLFQQNSNLTNTEIRSSLTTASIDKAFYAEHRLGDKYNVDFPLNDTRGLCSFRTELTLKFQNEDALIVGRGWEQTQKRQKLPDWHLDKLATISYKSRIVSALENTHHPKYVTEKLFDAFAALTVPIYYASNDHRVKKLVDDGSYINVFNFSIDEAELSVHQFEVSDEFISLYKGQQSKLAKLFSDYNALNRERRTVVQKVLNELTIINTLPISISV
ncbi:glycosyltransferase family 10 [Thalassotalea psychrophila]|uniref:Glycosyltransferase family 10 n=1 Tax=Thalassotalea psychrophila TaxID=3065647 RepID=A0ABY9TS97_9GAMM|nr:glycosyltransferase family 10 [Colwelliaceae bacterium SQ149]